MRASFGQLLRDTGIIGHIAGCQAERFHRQRFQNRIEGQFPAEHPLRMRFVCSFHTLSFFANNDKMTAIEHTLLFFILKMQAKSK